MVMHIDDLRRVAPLWLKFTEEVRQDKGNWGNTGDIFNDNGARGPPWISEMYGCVLLRHTTFHRTLLDNDS